MRLRPIHWLILSVMFFIAGVYVWRWADKRQEEKNRSTQPLAPSSKKTSSNRAATVQSAPAPFQLLSAASPLNSVPNQPAKKDSRFAYRVANTAKTVGQLARTETGILLENALIDTSLKGRPQIPESLRAKGEHGTYIVQAHGAIDASFRQMLSAAGATIIAYIPQNAYLVRVSSAGAQQLSDNGAQAVLAYEPYYKLKSDLLRHAVEQIPLPTDTTLNVLVFPGEKDSTASALEKAGAEVLGDEGSPFGTVLRVRPPSKALASIANLSGVQTIEVAQRRVVANDLSRERVRVSSNSVTAFNYLGLTGSNVVVNVNDTGVDTNHPDLLLRVSGDLPFSLIDSNGHGTHIAGIIAGDGNKSTTVTKTNMGSILPIPGPPQTATNGQFRGKAPAAKIFATKLNLEGGPFLSDRYLQETAAKTNAIISNNSWHYLAQGDYNLAAASYDAAVRDALPEVTGSQPLVYVFSAGNAGSGGDDGGGGASDSIFSPATAKNAITVGASEQPRNITNETVINCVTTNIGGTNVVTICTTNQPWLGQTDSSDQIAAFSSRGNVGVGTEGDFGRFKPDVVAPGTFVVSTRSTTWDEIAYYSPSNYQNNLFENQVLAPNELGPYSVFVPNNGVQLFVNVFSTVDLPIYASNVEPPTNAASAQFVRTNTVSIPPDAALNPGSVWFFTIQNTTTQTVTFTVETIVVTTNDFGNYFQVLSNLNNSIGTNPPHYYRFESGSSMSAAVVSGTLALMEEFYTNTFHATPSPALMKAMLINGARSLGGNYDFQVTSPINFQGWGLIQLTNSIPTALVTNMNLPAMASPFYFIDQNPTNALATGERQTRTIKVNNASARNVPLRFTLVWTDPPGNPAAGIKLVNDLDLVVTNLDTKEVFFGNDIQAGDEATSQWNTNGPPNIDIVNNVENVYLAPTPTLGSNYSVTVVGKRINVNAVTAHPNDVVQDYALVISSGNGQVSGALGPLVEQAIIATTTPNVTVLSNSIAGTDSNGQLSTAGGILLNQRVGANTPLRGTNTGIEGGQSTIGMTNQWHFYIVINTNTANRVFTNAAFVTFLPPTLSIPRMGVHERDLDNATRIEADIDMYMSKDPGLTNLSPIVLEDAIHNRNVSRSSRGRTGTESIVLSNANLGDVFYVGIKSEDYQAAEYGFFAIFSELPFGFSDGGGVVLRGVPVPAAIPDGTPSSPQGALVFAISPQPVTVRRVIVTNTISHGNMGDLLGNLSHGDGTGQQFAVLNNHSCILDASDNCLTNVTYVYEDNGQNDITGSQHTDGPGSLTDFIGQEGSGVWLLTMVDNALEHTGSVDGLSIRLEPQFSDIGDGSNAVTFTIGACGFGYTFIDVGPDVTNLTVSVTGNTQPVVLFVREGSLPTTNLFDQTTIITPPGGALSVTPFDNPPLRPGRYFIGVFNPCGNNPQTVRVVITLTKNIAAISSVFNTSVTNVSLLDDAVTYATFDVTNHFLISGLDVGLLIKHPRISDLAITLISPNGTRILLFENRGMSTTNGLGGSASGLGTFFLGYTNMVPFYTNDFDTSPLGWYAPGAVFDGWNVLTNFVAVMPDYNDLCLDNNVLVLTDGVVSNSLPTTNSTNYRLSFKVSHAPYIVGMVGWWPFDDDAVDIFGGHDGLLSGNVDFSTGEVNDGFVSDGIATSMKVPACPDLDVGTKHGFTIEGWVSPGPAKSIAYVVPGGTSGNQALPGTENQSLGMDFDVNVPIEIPALGVFDDGTNGLTSPLQVRVYDRDTQVSIADILFPVGTTGSLIGSSRFLDLPSPLVLTQGFHGVISVAYVGDPVEPNGNLGIGPGGWTTDDGNGAISFVGSARHSAPGTGDMYPNVADGGPVNRYAAGTFMFFPLPPPGPLVEWNSPTNAFPDGVQFWFAGLPGTNLPGSLWANIPDTNFVPHVFSTPPFVLTNSGWQHVALTYETANGSAKIYTNGQIAATASLGQFTPLTSGDLFFGYHPIPFRPGRSFLGGLDEFSIYDRALSDCQIAAIHSVTNRGKYGTNVLTCPVTSSIEIISGGTNAIFTFTNGLSWNTNGPFFETNFADFAINLQAPDTNSLPTNQTSLIVRPLDPNVAVDAFVLSALLTNTLDGLLHFTEDANLAERLIKFAPTPFAVSNFPPVLIFSNDFENATARVYTVGSIIRGGPNDPAIGARNWTVTRGPVTVVTNMSHDATGSNFIALARGAVSCDLPTAQGHRYQLTYNVRGPCAVGWWNGEVDPLSRRARDLIGGNNGAFFYGATNTVTPNNARVGRQGFYFDGTYTTNVVTNAVAIITNLVASKIELGDPQNLRLTNSFTMEGWIMPLKEVVPLAPETKQMLFFRGDSRECLDPYYLGIERVTDSQYDIIFHVENSFGNCGVILETADFPVLVDQWQHLAATFETRVPLTNNPSIVTNELRLYLNGQLLTNVFLEDPSEGPIFFTSFTDEFPFRDLDPAFSPGVALGNLSRDSVHIDSLNQDLPKILEPYRGFMDEWSVYDRALTDPEIAAISAAGTAGKADFAVPPSQSLAKLRVLLDNVETQITHADNSTWSEHTLIFTARQTNTVLTLESLLPGTLVDNVTLTEIPAELHYLPEETLKTLIGEDAFGRWRLEIVDSRVGATNDNPQLVNWQLQFTLAPSNPPPLIHLQHGLFYTNTLPRNGSQFFVVDVPQWATMATNILQFAANRFTGLPQSVNVRFSNTNLPTPADLVLIGPASSGVFTIMTNTTPSLTNGQPYYLEVVNPLPTPVTFGIGVAFDIVTLTNCELTTNYFVGPAGIPRYFQFDIPTNPPPEMAGEVTFWLTGARSNLTVVLSQHLPLPDLGHYDYISQRPCTNDEVLITLTNSTPWPIMTNRWYIGVYNSTATNVPFTVAACYTTNGPVIIPLTNAIPFVAATNDPFAAPPGPPRFFFFEFDVTNSVTAVLFELYNLSGDADLVLQRESPPGQAPYFAGSFQPDTLPEQIVIRQSVELPDLRGRWFLGVYNNEPTNIAYTIRAVVESGNILINGQPLNTSVARFGPRNILLQWNTIVGERYNVEFTTNLVPPITWTVVGTVVATTPTTTFVAPVNPVGNGFFRIVHVP